MKTLGEFYREKILTRKDLVARELPPNRGEPKVEKDLLGWKVCTDKGPIPCRSQMEARYLRVLLDAGMPDVCVPEDDEYLKAILPELEKLKTRIEEILSHYLDAILDRKIRERLRREVYMEITK